MPHIILGLGNEQFGLYSLITGFIAYSFTFNIGRAVTKYVAEFSARGETEKISQIISATFFLSLAVATVGSLTLVALTDFLVSDFLQIPPGARADTITAFYLAALCVWLMIIGQVFSAIVQATHRFDIFSAITTLTNISLVLGNLALVWTGFKFYHLILWNAATMFLSGSAYFILAKKIQPETRINFKFSREIFRLSARYGINVAGYQIFSNILLLWERSIITRVRGADDLTHYVVPMTITFYIHTFIASFMQNFLALTSDMFARNETERLEEIYRRATKIVAVLVVFMCVALSVGAKPILTSWINADFAEASTQVFILQIITYGTLACGIVAWQFIEGFGYPSYNMIITLGLLVISAPLMFILTHRVGIEGTALARLAGEIMIPIVIIQVERKIFGRFLWDLWRKIIFLLAVAGAVAGGAEYFILQSLPNNWFVIVGAIGVSGLIYVSIVWFIFYFSPEEKLWLKEKLLKGFA